MIFIIELEPNALVLRVPRIMKFPEKCRIIIKIDMVSHAQAIIWQRSGWGGSTKRAGQ
tara:strand:+ start:1947 stop:2120 length:174 start_codon:yes stop_codon:yes gene_type:complete